MKLVKSLFHAVVRVGGDVMVMHVGDKPYIVTPSGQVDASSRAMTADVLNGVLADVLPRESQQALEELHSIRYRVPPIPELRGEVFTVVAALSGVDDLWVEI